MNNFNCEAKNVSFFKGPVTNTRSTETLSLLEISLHITMPQYYEQKTRLLRNETDPVKRREIKTHLDSVTFSGVFPKRTDKEIQLYSQYACFDFDHLGHRLPELKRRLPEDPYFKTLLLFTSPSGDGLKWVTLLPEATAETHGQWYDAVAHYILYTYSWEVDPACRNLSRTCFLPYDPDCFVCEEMRPF